MLYALSNSINISLRKRKNGLYPNNYFVQEPVLAQTLLREKMLIAGMILHSKMGIALKEAGETGFWIDLLHKADYIDDKEYNSLYRDWNHIYAVLTKIVKTTKSQK